MWPRKLCASTSSCYLELMLVQLNNGSASRQIVAETAYLGVCLMNLKELKKFERKSRKEASAGLRVEQSVKKFCLCVFVAHCLV